MTLERSAVLTTAFDQHACKVVRVIDANGTERYQILLQNMTNISPERKHQHFIDRTIHAAKLPAETFTYFVAQLFAWPQPSRCRLRSVPLARSLAESLPASSVIRPLSIRTTT